MYQHEFVAGMGDFDFDGRYRGAACLDRAGDVRMAYFGDHGFPVAIFRQQRFMPLLLKDKLDYQRDIQPFERYRVSLTLAGLSVDGSRFVLRCDLIRSDGKTAAKVGSTCGWLDSNLQKLVVPPPQLIALLKELPMSSDYQNLQSAIK